jgi:hypothetical protein
MMMGTLEPQVIESGEIGDMSVRWMRGQNIPVFLFACSV